MPQRQQKESTIEEHAEVSVEKKQKQERVWNADGAESEWCTLRCATARRHQSACRQDAFNFFFFRLCASHDFDIILCAIYPLILFFLS
jgi:hypothetical protein